MAFELWEVSKNAVRKVLVHVVRYFEEKLRLGWEMIDAVISTDYTSHNQSLKHDQVDLRAWIYVIMISWISK